MYPTGSLPDINVATYNIGVPYDCKTVLLRTGQNSKDNAIQQIYAKINEIHAEAMDVYNKKADKGPWWENPSYQVTKEQSPIISQLRQQKLKKVFSDVLFTRNDIVFLQEVENLEDIAFIQTELPENFDFAYGKEKEVLTDGREKIAYDTFVCWNKSRFTRISEDDGRETSYRRTTCITLHDTLSGKIFEVASVHLRGFNLLNPQFAPKTESGFLDGDRNIHTLLEEFKNHKKLAKADVTVIGGDFNAEYNPSYHTDEQNRLLSTRRFSLLEPKFKRVSIPTDFHTSYNKDLTKFPEHENGLCTLDHFFVKSKGQMEAISNNCLNNNSPIEDISRNSSDHRYIGMKIIFQ